MKFNILKSLFVTGALAACLVSCKKDAPDQWLKDNTTIIGKYPVIASFTLAAAQTVSAGNTVKLDLRYWSDDPIDKINLNATVGSGAKQAISATPYQKAYSTVSRTDSLILQYQVPAGAVSGTVITMEAQVVNKNALNKSTLLNLTVK